MTLSQMLRMHGDLVDERCGSALGTNENADRIGACEGNHAAAAPDLEVADRPLEGRRSYRGLVRKVRQPAAIQRVDEQSDVIGPAKAISTHLRLRAKRSGRPGRSLAKAGAF